nr:unnamed protein product [Callosobruchus chinensis]
MEQENKRQIVFQQGNRLDSPR